MGALVRSMDWSRMPLGPIATWPASLRTTVNLALASNFPISIAWGPQRVQIYNDGYWPICGAKHPRSMGQDFKTCWLSAWPAIGDAFESASAGRTAFLENQRMFLDRHGYLEETFFTFSFSPIRDEAGQVAGLFHPVTEMTEQLLTQRRLGVLREIADEAADASTVVDAAQLVVRTLARHPLDVPCAALYLLDAEARNARLAGATRLEPGSPAAPWVVSLTKDAGNGWPLADVARSGAIVHLDRLEERFGSLGGDPYPESPREATVLPVLAAGVSRPLALLAVAASPRRPFDDAQRTFHVMLQDAATNALVGARAYEEERNRAEALAELDRAKTLFFTNVSHEFRTPLTLMLGPLEELLAARQGEDGAERELPVVAERELPVVLPDVAERELPGIAERELPVVAERELLDVAHRHGLRLLKLVNTLLDFSRIQAGRAEVAYEPTDLAALTEELASMFRAAIERAGMRLVVDCQPLAEDVYVDRDMWEKIVLNLLSNAFKFTFDGEIQVRLREEDGRAVLRVRDTGVGIPPADQRHVFERFHRVEGARGRSHEGTGIGLALVRELTKLHGGTADVESVVGDGTTFTVAIPLGSDHLPQDRIGGTRGLSSTSIVPRAYVEEAIRWLPDAAPPVAERSAGKAGSRARGRILLADDNADMRGYVRRLLAERFEVEAVANGRAALEAIRRDPPDLILSDVMMPELDGFELLARVRADPALRETPFLILSARAGEEARIEGARAGADDYVSKPFSARELLARVESHLKVTRERAQLNRALRESQTLFQTLADVAPTILWMTEPDGTCSFLSRGWYELTGQTQEEALGSGWLEAVHPDDRERTERIVCDATARRAPFSLDYRLRRADGAYRWAMNAGRPRLSEAGELLGYVGSVIEVHERKQVEQALRGSEERYRRLFESIDEGFCVIEMLYDAEGRPYDYCFREVNPAFAAQTGIEDAVGRSMREIAPEHEEHWYEIYGRIAATGESVRFEHWAQALGRYYDVYAFRIGQPEQRRVAVVFNDVTERKRTQDALSSSEERYRAIVESQAELVCRFRRDGTILFANGAYARAFGTTPEALVGGSFWSIVPDEDRPAVEALLDELSPERREGRIENRLETPEGVRWMLWTNHGLQFDEDRCVLEVQSAGIDITQRKLVEEALREADRKKDEFLATLAHELRNPLAPLRNGLEVMKLPSADVETVAQVRAMMERQLAQMVRLIDDLLDLSRISRGKITLRRESVRVADVVEQAVETSWPGIEEAGHHLELRVPREPIHVNADPVRLAQVFANLLNNAAKFTPRGGHIALSVEPAEHEVVVSVRDDGVGISSDMLPRIFGMFTQVEREADLSQGGLGIGLSLVRGLVEMHGGTVEAHSGGLGTGSEFIVRLPAAPSAGAARAGDAPGARQGVRRRILVVDDNRDAAASLAMLLRMEGNDTRTAHDGLEALESAEEFRPDIVLLDLGMPRLNGYDAARRIREQTWGGRMILVAVTGWGESDDRVRSREAGFDHHLVKPVEPRALLDMLADLQPPARRNGSAARP